MKKFLVLVNIALILLAGCSSTVSNIEPTPAPPEYIDEEFLIDLEKAILNRIEMGNENASYLSVVNAEYTFVSKYTDKDLQWENDDLRNLAWNYVSGLEIQKKAVEDTELQYNNFWIEWYDGALKRYNVIVDLYQNYGAFTENAQIIENNYVSSLSALEKTYNGLNEVGKDLASQFDGVHLNYDSRESAVVLSVKNNTEYTYDVTFFFHVFDNEGVRIGDASSYFTMVKPGSNNNFKIYINLSDFDEGTYELNWELNIYY